MGKNASNQFPSGTLRCGLGTGVLLGVWAHPDDDAYLSAGPMADGRAAGHRVVVATATKGELMTGHPDHQAISRLVTEASYGARNKFEPGSAGKPAR